MLLLKLKVPTFIFLLLLCTFIQELSSSRCDSSSFADHLGIVRLDSTIEIDSNLKFCQNLKDAGQSCCSESEIESIQDKVIAI